MSSFALTRSSAGVRSICFRRCWPHIYEQHIQGVLEVQRFDYCAFAPRDNNTQCMTTLHRYSDHYIGALNYAVLNLVGKAQLNAAARIPSRNHELTILPPARHLSPSRATTHVRRSCVIRSNLILVGGRARIKLKRRRRKTRRPPRIGATEDRDGDRDRDRRGGG